MKTKKRAPTRVFYIVNPEFSTMPPDRRQKVLASDPDTVEEFKKDDGVVLSTVDLFRLHRDRDRLGLPEIQRLVMEASGRLLYEGPEEV